MRSDMAKVIVERPRCGGLRKSRQKGYRRYLQRARDVLPIREPMLGHWNGGTKYFSERLGPLRRYLRSQVGRPWNKVYSEICRHIRPDSVVQQHVLTHVWDYVTLNIVLRSGIPCLGESRRFGEPLGPDKFYVCPNSGLLKITKRRARQLHVRRIMVNEGLQYHLVNGIWHEIRLRKLPSDPERCWDAFLQKSIGAMRPAELSKTYGLVAYALSVRVLSKREGKALPGSCT